MSKKELTPQDLEKIAGGRGSAASSSTTGARSSSSTATTRRPNPQVQHRTTSSSR